MTRWVRTLLAANILAYFVQLTVPGFTELMMFIPGAVLTRPWTILTYMFIHAPYSWSHIIFNMLGLYFFGSRVESRLGSSRFLQLYLVSGIAGAALSFVFARHAAIYGASAAVFGVSLAFAMFWPREKIFIGGVFPVEARVLLVISTVVTLWSIGSGMGGGVAHFAHLGGYVGAYIYLKMVDPTRTVARFRAKTVAPTSSDQIANWKRVDVQKVHEVNRDELNRILDKINEKGLGSLTPQEKLFLSNFVPRDDRPVS